MSRTAELFIFWSIFIALFFSCLINESMRIENRAMIRVNAGLNKKNATLVKKNSAAIAHIKSIFWKSVLQEDGNHKHRYHDGMVWHVE